MNHVNNREYLLKKYKHKITPGKKSVEELIDFLKVKVDIVEIPITELIQSVFQHILNNVVRSIQNQELNLTTEELNFIAYKLIKNNRSNPYYQCGNIPIIVQNCKGEIYIVFEKKTGYIYVNNNKLLLELFIECGISQYDYDNDTILLYNYLFYLDSYSNGEY